ncbi:cell division cycle protein 20 homolog [Patiria miniata]|uniref:CDC20/Fizzy WD40 domain-containing protein n=1 Tax=Patiria miniata TaxID=46514 RepID=A0A913ZFJ3_PATMI|nr:cell division cycle protein 20 homolog [Patiria miniata]XP_038050566.1 cell division cycle protein 20 homolog [Patiria miniata]XP_038050567.1 cell division cycle protein 20 homolog [Patiria miniata]XP_038050568.1 cell division cycle protein 20 homolog [Patiria miniata]
MAHFQFEASVSELVRLDGPLLRAPVPRWQRKAMERRDSNYCWSPTSPAPMSLSRSKTPKRTPLTDTSLWGTNSKTPSKTPGKTPGNKQSKTPSSKPPTSAVLPPSNQGDRFIPNRALMDIDFSNFRINNTDEIEEGDDGKDKAYNSALSEMLTGKTTENAKILTLKQKAPKAQEGYYNNLKVLYSSSKSDSTVKAKAGRYISSTPDNILDAPGLRNDFYLNLVDWGARNMVAVALENEVYIWNASDGTIQHLMTLEDAEDYLCSVSWIKEGNILALGNSQGQVQLWDVEKTKCLRTMGGHAARIGSLSWNEFILSSGSRSGKIHQHDVRVADHQVATLDSHTQEICSLKWSPDGQYLASGGNDNLVCMWDASAGTAPVHSLTQHQAAVKALAWCPWQPNILASGGGTADRTIRFWNSNTGLCLNSVDTGSQVSAILWSSAYKELISSHGYAQYQLSIWKYPMMQRVVDLKGHTNRILSMCMSPDQTVVMSAAGDETLRRWSCFTSIGAKQKSVKGSKTRTSHALSVGQIR